MLDCEFECRSAAVDRYAAAPAIRLRMAVSETTGVTVHTAALRCQVRIEPHRRDYTAGESELLAYLFGDPSRWGETLQPMQLATVATVLPGFTGGAEFEVVLPCSYDLEVAAGKYLHTLATGEIPLLLLFSGTVFTRGGGGLQIQPVPWHCETTFRLPVRIWREVMDHFFPGSGWLRLRRETLDALLRYKAVQAIPTWDEALNRLVAEAEGASR
ncbi:hypothetical protein JQS43_07465 [Natronosporangium hydrolyticum]|uniref:Uncharacterized protein n=1 Tax=Natronosporangium hydrolyticum TaxID=2811111 RepID=A0A895YJB7_9ACTN|nr:DUF6084 family protein [Natronosporangium hydrolyticum]QSB16132.1 hypothetical protein JQS43_07465 [Natronosporangium hydrolyticum]